MASGDTSSATSFAAAENRSLQNHLALGSLQMRNLEEQNERIAEFLVTGDASRMSTPCASRRQRGVRRAPSEIGCAPCLFAAARAPVIPPCRLRLPAVLGRPYSAVCPGEPAKFSASGCVLIRWVQCLFEYESADYYKRMPPCCT